MAGVEKAIADLKRLEDDLGRMRTRVVRRASAATLTEMATRTRENAKANIKSQFTLRKGREQWTLRGIRSTRQSATQPLARQFTRAGAVRYPDGRDNPMALQETGGKIPYTSGRTTRVTTAQGAGQGDRATPRTRVATAANRVRLGAKVDRPISTRGMSRRQRNVAAVRRAKRRGRRLVLMRLAGSNKVGIFRRRGRGKQVEIKMVHRLYQGRRLAVRARPWLTPAAERVRIDGETIGVRQLDAAVRKARLFR